MTKDEALLLALEALEGADEIDCDMRDAITAIKAALEAKDEPYAFEAAMYSNDRVKVDPVTGNVSIGTSQRTWVGLTDEEIDKAWRSVDYTVPWDQHRIDIARAIEAKLKEKNTWLT